MRRRQLTLGNGPPKEMRSSVSDIHFAGASSQQIDRRGIKGAWNTHLLCRSLASVVVDVHFPLVEGGDGKCGFSLRFGHAGVVKVCQCPARELKEPCWKWISSATLGTEWKKKKSLLQPSGVSANFITVSLTTSSGREEIRAERMNHCLPAVCVGRTRQDITLSGIGHPTFSAKNLGNAVLLVQEPLLVDFVEQAFLAVPRQDGC